MTEQKKLDYYALHGRRPPENYIIYRFSYRTGKLISRQESQFNTTSEAKNYCQEFVNSSTDDGRIALLFIDRKVCDTISEDFEELVQMFWPEGILADMEMFFEIA